MMLHRHFEKENQNEHITKLSNVSLKEKEYVSEVFPPDENTVEAPKRRGRPKKSDAE